MCCVTGTEKQLLPACHVLFWNQVVQTNQFRFLALGLLIFGLFTRRVFFVLWRAHVSLFLLSAIVPTFGSTEQQQCRLSVCHYATGISAADRTVRIFGQLRTQKIFRFILNHVGPILKPVWAQIWTDYSECGSSMEREIRSNFASGARSNLPGHRQSRRRQIMYIKNRTAYRLAARFCAQRTLMRPF